MYLLLAVSLLGPASGSIFSRGEDAPPTAAFKGYSGLRASLEAPRVAYYADQTIAVLEITPKRLILNCEVIEVYEPEERMTVLGQVSNFTQPHRISMQQMMDLMDRCQRVETPPSLRTQLTEPAHATEAKPRASAASLLLSGVIPGTLWCGTGDLAETYFDLGEERAIDKCCRTHDLCPSKIRARSTRYNISNENMYTKSHCKCDLQFQKCLKKTKSNTADLMGHFYFDLLRIPCIDSKEGRMIMQTPESYS